MTMTISMIMTNMRKWIAMTVTASSNCNPIKRNVTAIVVVVRKISVGCCCNSGVAVTNYLRLRNCCSNSNNYYNQQINHWSSSSSVPFSSSCVRPPLLSLCRPTTIAATTANTTTMTTTRTYMQYDNPDKNFIQRNENDGYSSLYQQSQHQQPPSPSNDRTSIRDSNNNISTVTTRYVWNEPPGRMKHILDIVRMSERRLLNLQLKKLPKIQEIYRRIRLSNSAMVTRISTIQELYADCAEGLRQLCEKVTAICQRQQVPNYQSIAIRRKYQFQNSSSNENDISTVDDDDDDSNNSSTTTTTATTKRAEYDTPYNTDTVTTTLTSSFTSTPNSSTTTVDNDTTNRTTATATNGRFQATKRSGGDNNISTNDNNGKKHNNTKKTTTTNNMSRYGSKKS